MRERITMASALIRKCDEANQFLGRGTGINSLACQMESILKACRFAPCDKSGSGVQTDDVPFGAFTPLENVTSDRGILLRRPSGKLFGRDQRQSKLRRVQHRSEEHTSELQSLTNLVCRLLLEQK